MVCCRRLPGCPDTCSKLLQAALQLQDAAVQAPLCQTQQHPTADSSEHLHGVGQLAEAEQPPLLQPKSDVLQVTSLLVHFVDCPPVQNNRSLQAQAVLVRQPLKVVYWEPE